MSKKNSSKNRFNFNPPSLAWLVMVVFFVVLALPQTALAGNETFASKGLRLSFHVGATYPLGIGSLPGEFGQLEDYKNLNDLADSNVHFRFNFEYALNDKFNLMVFAGFSQFTDDYTVAIHYYTFNVSGNVKVFFGGTCSKWYLQLGPGWYIPKPNLPLPYPTTATVGGNIGIGTRIPISGSCALEWGIDMHSINFFNNDEPKFWFLTLQLGVLF